MNGMRTREGGINVRIAGTRTRAEISYQYARAREGGNPPASRSTRARASAEK